MAAIDRWYAKTDGHPLLEAEKKRVRGKPRGALATLESQRTLGVMLLALGRKQEAVAVFQEAAAAARPTGKMSPWYVAAGCAALAHWVNGASLEPLRRFVKPAPHAAQELQPDLWTRQRFASELKERWSAYAAEARDDDPLSLDAMASHLMEIVFLRQLHLLAPVHQGKVPLASTDARIAKALAVMRKKLEKTSALLRPRART